MKKEIIEWGIVVLVVIALITLLGVINNNGMKRCVEAGHSETYCKERLR